MSVRGYAYRIGGMATYDEDGNITGGIKLHGDYCTKEPPAPGEDPVNNESIQRYVLYGRRTGRLPYSSVIDDTRPTLSGGAGWASRDRAIEYADNARKNMIKHYSLDIWTPQRKYVEVLSEKQALEPIVKRPCVKWRSISRRARASRRSRCSTARRWRSCSATYPPCSWCWSISTAPGRTWSTSLETNIRAIIAMLCRDRGLRRARSDVRPHRPDRGAGDQLRRGGPAPVQEDREAEVEEPHAVVRRG